MTRDDNGKNQIPDALRGYGEIYRCAARLVFYDATVYPALYAIQGKAFASFNHWFGHDTNFRQQNPSDMSLALCLMGAVVDDAFGDECEEEVSRTIANEQECDA